jgi:hypothetical protein
LLWPIELRRHQANVEGSVTEESDLHCSDERPFYRRAAGPPAGHRSLKRVPTERLELPRTQALDLLRLPLSPRRHSGPANADPRTSRGNTRCAGHRQNRPPRKQHCLKAASRPARARIVATQFFDQLLVAVHDALPALHARLRREAISPLAGPLKRTSLESVDCVWLESSMS